VCSHTATCPTASGFAFRLGGARVLPCVSWHQLPPLASTGSGAATCPVVSTPASRLGAARVSPRVPWCQLPPPGLGQLGCHHASRGTSSRLPARGSSGAATDPRYSADHGLSKYTNIPPWNYYCNILSGCSHIFQNATRQDWRHTPARHAAGGAFNASKTCGQGVARLQQCGADLLPTHGGSLQCRVARQLCAAEPPQCRVTQ
jgi:hypothetical protein